jgi:hypothetical protein
MPTSKRSIAWALASSRFQGPPTTLSASSNVSGGGRGRNTEILAFDDADKIVRAEVYFGWNLE